MWIETDNGANSFLKAEPKPTPGFIAAMDWLATQRTSSRMNSRNTSYGYKHQAERWNRDRGVEIYIPEQELIAAAHYLGFKIKNTDLVNIASEPYKDLYGETYTSVFLNIAIVW